MRTEVKTLVSVLVLEVELKLSINSHNTRQRIKRKIQDNIK
jgi:hypothetical protein